jgi:glycosyltransferase involved in cell wall biosynthesis
MEIRKEPGKDKDLMTGLPYVSLIIPTFNEERFIGPLLDKLLAQAYPPERLEILIADGLSKDKTPEIVLDYAQKHSMIRFLINDKRYVPFGLNLGIRSAKGELIIILGAHAEYPGDYVSKLVTASATLRADLVGGVTIASPADQSTKSLAIAKALSCSFGVGNSGFRIGANSVKQVDTVAFGCYRREVFEKVGFFDETLIRNQDDELSARIIKARGSIYLVPDIKVTYYTRSKIKEVIGMLYQYGLFKPLVSLKIGKHTSIRQLIPLVFVLFLIVSSAGFILDDFFGLVLAGGMIIYLLADLYFSLKLAMGCSKWGIMVYLPWLFFCMHCSYGWGYLRGIFHFIIFKKQKTHIEATR